MKKKKLVILVIASRSNIYDKMINEYWKYLINYCNIKHKNIKIFLIFGNNVNVNDLSISNKNILVLDCEESYIPGILTKTLKSFKFIKNNYDFKYILRTNLSSFIILEKLTKYINKLPENNIYCGKIVDAPKEDNATGIYWNLNEDHPLLFISGSGILLSKDNIDHILNYYDNKKIRYDLIDDIEIGRILKGKEKQELAYIEIINNDKNLDVIKLINNNQNNNKYQVRIKNENDRNLDIKFMKILTNYFYKDKIEYFSSKNNHCSSNNYKCIILIILIILLSIIFLNYRNK
tara:strand:+ start:4318 stop:5190 length:873 start_codon:yes stop_codon:yes gene_type:complete